MIRVNKFIVMIIFSQISCTQKLKTDENNKEPIVKAMDSFAVSKNSYTLKKYNKGCQSISQVGDYQLGYLLDKEGRKYQVISSFDKIPTGDSYRGVSRVTFSSDSFKKSYRLDLPSELPIQINKKNNSLIFCVDQTMVEKRFDSLESLLCTPFGCF